MAFPVSVPVGKAEDEADPAVSTDKKLDNAEAGSGRDTVLPAPQKENKTSKTVGMANILILRRGDRSQNGWKRRRLGSIE